MSYGEQTQSKYQIISFDNDQFPSSLTYISDPPKQLFVRGHVPTKTHHSIAIVGTRKATATGIAFAREIAHTFASNGITVISGLALGIDAAAHSGALQAGGITIAVLGNGIDKIYPAQNIHLANTILSSDGGIVSEYGPNTPSYKYQFVQRNRIISGLADAVVVLEAPARSGALATARFAAEQGKDVFVIPGPVKHPNYVGSHELIRDGAILAASAEHILADMNINDQTEIQAVDLSGLSEIERCIYTTLKTAGHPVSIDEIITKSHLSPHIVNQTLTLLTIKNIVLETPNGYSI